MKTPTVFIPLLAAVLCGTALARSAAADEVVKSRESTAAGLRVVLLAISREVILTGEQGPEKAVRHRLRVTFVVERLAEPKKSEELKLGELQVLLAGTDKRVDVGPNIKIRVVGYPLDKYPYADRVPLPEVKVKERASVYELDMEPLTKIEGKAIDIRIKGIGLGDKVRSCEFQNVPLE